MANLADRLLTGVKRRVIIPSSQPLLLDSDILQMADDTIASYMVPLLMSTSQEYFVTKVDQALTVDVDTYNIPYRAIGRVLRDLKIRDSSGSIKNVPRIQPEESHEYIDVTSIDGHYFQGDKFVLVGSPSQTGLIAEVSYSLAPSKLIVESEAATVVSIAGDMVTVDAVPSDLTANAVIDFIQGKSGNSLYSMDVEITSVAGNTLTFGTEEVPDDLVAGDYIALAGYSPVIMLPNEAYSLLETTLAMRILDTIGDFEGSAKLGDTKSREERDLKLMVEPRNQGENQMIVNRRSLLRGRNTRFRRGLIW